jgi:hypothetical protein
MWVIVVIALLVLAVPAFAELPAPGHQSGLPVAATDTAPDGTPAVRIAEEPVAVAVPAEALGEVGTLGFWLRLPHEVRSGDAAFPLIASDAIDVAVRERENLVNLILTFGPTMLAQPQARPRIAGLLTHLKADRWYHVAFTWNAAQPDNHFILDGLDQGTPEPQAQPGAVKAAEAQTELRLGAPGVTISAPTFWGQALAAKAFAEHLRTAGHPRYEDEGINYTDETLRSEDIADKELIYSTDFDDEAELGNWVREGGESATIVDGRLRLQTGPSAEQGQHIVFWLKREIPPDFLAEWQFRPYDKQNGLTIVFFNARGRNGESIFDPKLAPRDGTFVQYTNGDLDAYHISYYAGHRGSVNLRKNHGFLLAAIGSEYVHGAPPETFHTITLLKQGGTIRLAVDGKVSLKFDDDGQTYGPIHDHSGWFGLRQMFQAWYTEYDDLRIWGLK